VVVVVCVVYTGLHHCGESATVPYGHTHVLFTTAPFSPAGVMTGQSEQFCTPAVDHVSGPH
jgi:hypothetical protein